MGKKKTLLLVVLIIIIDCFFGFAYNQFYQKGIGVQLDVSSDSQADMQMFYANKQEEFNEASSLRFHIPKKYENVSAKTKIDYRNNNLIRIDFDESKATKTNIKAFSFYRFEVQASSMKSFDNIVYKNNVSTVMNEEELVVDAAGEDPYLVVAMDKDIISAVMGSNNAFNMIVIGGGIVLINIVLVMAYFFIRKNQFVRDLLQNRNLTWNLSKNDFKTKYAGSFFGVMWAFVQPVVTIILYWFVFQVGFRSGDVGDFPFVLWLIVGLVPWFFFQDAISAGTNCLVEYSYLVKKMVFRVEVLPFVKIISALFVHLFFIGFTFLIFGLNGYFPTIYAVQIIYYLICALALVTGITFITSCVMVFFKDLGQLIQIILQIGMWMTPIMWNKEMIPVSMHWLLEFNPMYYIVDGFRDSFINHAWFWEKIDVTINFWLLVIFLFALGLYLFRKLKIHFADVL